MSKAACVIITNATSLNNESPGVKYESKLRNLIETVYRDDIVALEQTDPEVFENLNILLAQEQMTPKQQRWVYSVIEFISGLVKKPKHFPGAGVPDV